MLWILLEAALALALLVGIVIWVVAPTQKKTDGIDNSTAPAKPPSEEKERKDGGHLEDSE